MHHWHAMHGMQLQRSSCTRAMCDAQKGGQASCFLSAVAGPQSTGMPGPGCLAPKRGAKRTMGYDGQHDFVAPCWLLYDSLVRPDGHV